MEKTEDFLAFVSAEYMDRLGETGDVSGTITKLHNSNKIDVVKKFLEIQKESQNYDFFSLKSIFEKILPEIVAPTLDVVCCVKKLILESGQDGSTYWIIDPFIGYCSAEPKRVDEVIESELNEIDIQVDLLTPAIIAGSKLSEEKYFNKAVELLSHGSDEIVKRAIHALGRIEYGTRNDLVNQAFLKVAGVASKGGSDEWLAAAVRPLVWLYKENDSLEEALLGFLQDNNLYAGCLTAYAVSEILFREKELDSSGILSSLLNLATKVQPKNLGTINNLDYALARMIKNGHPGRAIEFVESLLNRSECKITLSNFKSFSGALLESDHLSRVVTRWLQSGRTTLGRACHDLLSMDGETGIELAFDLSLVYPDESDSHAFLARKACGWLFTRPISAISLLVSLVENCPDDQLAVVSDIAFNPLLISYPGSVRDYLGKQSTDGSEKVAIFSRGLLEKLESYHQGIRDASDIKELRPTDDQRFSYQRYHQKQMSGIIEDAHKGSLMSIIGVQTSVLLYGRKSIQYVNRDEQKTRHEVPLQLISHSIEFPSLHNIDSEGLEHQLRWFKLEGCDR